jgi:serine/threonine-protein kinase
MSVPAESLPLDALVGRSIDDRFRLTSLIARGGMATVYRAEQAPFGRICAVKLLGPDQAAAGEIGWALDRRFALESAITSRLNHPNIVTVFDCGRTADGILYMAMEHLRGRTLQRAIREASALPEQRAILVALQVCRALGAAHAAGVVHRDVKPANVFLVEGREEPDFVKLLDFGLVTNVLGDRGEELTEKNLLLGSPRYMAPEQIRGEAVDARTDIYALGVVIYEMVTGRAPFEGPSSGRVLAAHLDEAVPPMRTRDGGTPSPQLERLVRRCLEKRPDRRFGSIEEVRRALESVPTQPLAATPLTRGGGARGRAFPWLRDSTLAGALAIVVVAAMVGAASHHARSGSAAPRTSAAPLRAVGSSAESPSFRPPSGEGRRAGSTSALPPVAGDVQSGRAVTIEVMASPEDAVVREGNVDLCPSTPCAIVYEGSEADRHATHLLTLARDGYRSRTVRIAAADGALSVDLARVDQVPDHERRPAGHPYVPAAPLRPESALLSGYRLDVPY